MSGRRLHDPYDPFDLYDLYDLCHRSNGEGDALVAPYVRHNDSLM
jgi:hypothetical protein